jgi:hypothetical protein
MASLKIYFFFIVPCEQRQSGFSLLKIDCISMVKKVVKHQRGNFRSTGKQHHSEWQITNLDFPAIFFFLPAESDFLIDYIWVFLNANLHARMRVKREL